MIRFNTPVAGIEEVAAVRLPKSVVHHQLVTAMLVVVAKVVGLLAMRPWSPRRVGKWPFVWLVGRGVSFAFVLILAVLIYSATQPRPLAFGLAIAAGYFAALLAEVAVYAAHVRSVTGEGADAVECE